LRLTLGANKQDPTALGDAANNVIALYLFSRKLKESVREKHAVSGFERLHRINGFDKDRGGVRELPL
jgi:hypothetical protein